MKQNDDWYSDSKQCITVLLDSNGTGGNHNTDNDST